MTYSIQSKELLLKGERVVVACLQLKVGADIQDRRKFFKLLEASASFIPCASRPLKI